MTRLLLPMLVAGLVVAGCSSSTPPSSSGGQAGDTPAAADKQGDTSKSGTLSQVGERFFLTAPGGQPEEIESYSVDLSQYVGQSVTVTGQFSGDTLFVAEVE